MVFGLAVFFLAGFRGIPARTLVTLALLFEVGGSYGIAFAEYQGLVSGLTAPDGTPAGFGLS